MLGLLQAGLGVAGGLKGLFGGGGSKQTSANEPWKEAQPWMKDNIKKGQDLQGYYEQNPFSAQQKQSYGQAFDDLGQFRNQNMQALQGLSAQGGGGGTFKPGYFGSARNFDELYGGGSKQSLDSLYGPNSRQQGGSWNGQSGGGDNSQQQQSNQWQALSQGRGGSGGQQGGGDQWEQAYGGGAGGGMPPGMPPWQFGPPPGMGGMFGVPKNGGGMPPGMTPPPGMEGKQMVMGPEMMMGRVGDPGGPPPGWGGAGQFKAAASGQGDPWQAMAQGQAGGSGQQQGGGGIDWNAINPYSASNPNGFAAQNKQDANKSSMDTMYDYFKKRQTAETYDKTRQEEFRGAGW